MLVHRDMVRALRPLSAARCGLVGPFAACILACVLVLLASACGSSGVDDRGDADGLSTGADQSTSIEGDGMDARPDDTPSGNDSQSDAATADDVDAVSVDSQVEVDATFDVDVVAGPPQFMYDPLAGERLETFPDDYYTVDDETSLTGLRVKLDSSSAPWFASLPTSLVPAFDDANLLDGFGTTAGIILRFTQPIGEVPSGDPASLTNDVVMLFELGGAAPRRIPFEVKRLDQGATLVLLPMLPLRPKARHGVVVTRALLGLDQQPVEPSPVLTALLTGTASDPRLVRLQPRYSELLAAASLTPSQVSAAVVFTTQSIVDRSVAIAQDIKSRSFVWKDAPVCEEMTTYRRCEGRFLAGDYRNDGVIDGVSPHETYLLPVTIYLPPKSDGGPWPVVFFAHGITGDRHQAELLIPKTGNLTTAMVSIDAVAHGDHPAGAGSDSFSILAMFFEIDLATRVFRPAKLRDNFRQSTYDKLQTLALIGDNLDVDGDAKPDLDLTKLGYFGVSLGAIMGSELLALSDRFVAAVLSVGGGRIISIISDGTSFKLITNLVTPPGWTADDLKRSYPLAQTVVDPGDGANYAPYVLGERLAVGGNLKPNVLCIMALGDSVVPNVATSMLVRAMGLPLLPTVFLDPGLLPTVDSLPLSGNLEEGTLTAGFFQYDRYSTIPGGEPKPAGHQEIHLGVEFPLQSLHFFESLLETGTAEIIDPYSVLGTPPLP